MQPKPFLRVTQKGALLRYLGGRYPKTSAPGSLVAKAIFAACFCLVSLSRAAGPTNDFCSGAEVIPGNAGAASPYYTTVKDISLATTNNDPPRICQDFVAHSIWYVFTPNTNAIYTISSCNDPSAPTATTVSDTVMTIYQSSGGCLGPFTAIECDDDSCGPGTGLQSSITRPLLANTTYYIVIWQYFDPMDPPLTAGNVQLRVTRALRPANDTCATATPVPLNFPIGGSTVGAENNYQLPAGNSCFTGMGQVASTAPGPDVVFSFTAPRADTYNFKVYNYNTDNNLVLYVAGSCPPAGTPAIVTDCLGAANRSSASSAEEVVCVSLAAGQRVFLFVDEHGNTTGSSFTLEVSPCIREREPNNGWSSASFAACGITGSIQPGGDVDFYHLGSPPAGSRAFVMVDGQAASSTGFDLRLTTTTDTIEYDDKDNDLAFGSFSPNIAGAILPGGPVYARVDFDLPSPTEPYHLYAVIQPPLSAAAPEVEPNNTAAQATFADIQYYTGNLPGPAPSTDTDMFTFTADASELVFISLDGDPLRNNTPINAKLELLDEFGNILVTVDDDDASSSTNSAAGLAAVTPRSPGEALVYRVVNDGTYFVRVTISPGTVGPAGAGDYLLSIARNCFNGTSGFMNTPMTVSPITVSPAPEGGTNWLSGTLQDPDSWQSHTVVINWGDGSTTTHYLPGGAINFSIPHIYVDDDPTATGADTYPVQVTISEPGVPNIIRNSNASVNNAPPVINTLTITSPISVSDTATLTGTFSDAGAADTFALTVNWGDGTSAQTANYSAGTSSFSLTHQYSTGGSNNVVVTLQDDDGGSANANVAVLVRANGGAAATFRSIAVGPNGVALRAEGTPNTQYHIEYSLDLKTWTAFPPVTADPSGTILYQDTTTPRPPQKFYRAVSP